jgi:hypothetical protein
LTSIDVNVGAGLPEREKREAVRARADELKPSGAVELGEHLENGEYWIVMHDPEGNEFCLR